MELPFTPSEGKLVNSDSSYSELDDSVQAGGAKQAEASGHIFYRLVDRSALIRPEEEPIILPQNILPEACDLARLNLSEAQPNGSPDSGQPAAAESDASQAGVAEAMQVRVFDLVLASAGGALVVGDSVGSTQSGDNIFQLFEGELQPPPLVSPLDQVNMFFNK